jgi:hypothetical protein
MTLSKSNLFFVILFLHCTYLLQSQTNYHETFDVDPTQPTSFYGVDDWAVFIHSRNKQYQLDSTYAHHGPFCQPPISHNGGAGDSSHWVSDFEDAVYYCKNHIMTSIRADGYGLINLVPDHMVHLEDEARISVDVSTMDEAGSGRDWFTIMVVPYEDFNPLTAGFWVPDLSGPARNIIWMETGYNNGRRFTMRMVDNDFNDVELPISNWSALEDYITPSKTTRTTFELRIKPYHIKLGMKLPENHPSGEEYLWWVDTGVDNSGNPIHISWTDAMVMLGHYSYNPRKNNGGIENTWHWDNLRIEPAVPFDINQSTRRYADASDPVLTFEDEITIGSRIVFSAPDYTRIADAIRVSLDNGTTWINPQRIPAGSYDPDDTWGPSYAALEVIADQPTTSLRFQGIDSPHQQWMVRDVYAFNESESILPVSLISLSAISRNDRIDINWSTQDEYRHKEFVLQRRNKNNKWDNLAILQGNDGAGPYHYHYEDHRPSSGWNEYRLRMIDSDGNEEYSHMVRTHYSSGAFIVFPNPANYHLSILPPISEEKLNVVLYNAMGQKVMELNKNNEYGKEIQMALPDGLANGLYNLIINTDSGRTVRKVSILR